MDEDEDEHLPESFEEPFAPRADGFDMALVSSSFEKALEISEDIDLRHYLIGYRELERIKWSNKSMKYVYWLLNHWNTFKK